MNKKKSKQKYKPLSEATLEELTKAFKMAGLWITGELMNEQMQEGAFSEAFLGEPAVEYFPKQAYLRLTDPKCKWKWKEGTKLSTLLINVVKSEMGHALERYEAQGEPDVMPGSSFEREDGEDGWDDANDVLEVDPEGFKIQGYTSFKSDYEQQQELAEELRKWESRRDAGLKIARAAAQGDALMEKYVEAVFSLPDERSVCKRMKKTKAEVLEIEATLIERIKVMLG